MKLVKNNSGDIPEIDELNDLAAKALQSIIGTLNAFALDIVAQAMGRELLEDEKRQVTLDAMPGGFSLNIPIFKQIYKLSFQGVELGEIKTESNGGKTNLRFTPHTDFRGEEYQ